MAYCDKWRFNDCVVIEDIDSFEVEVVRHGVHAHQAIVPADMEDFRDALDTALIDEALADGPSPLYLWKDGAGVTVGYEMKASRQDLATIIRNAEFQGGETGPEDVGDQFQFVTRDGYLLVVYTSESFPNDDATDREIIDTAESFAVVERSEGIPNRWDMIKLFGVED